MPDAFTPADVLAVGGILLLVWILVLVRDLRHATRKLVADRSPAPAPRRPSRPSWVPGDPEPTAPDQDLGAARRLAMAEALGALIARDLETGLAGGDLPAAVRSAAARAKKLARVAGAGRVSDHQTTLTLLWPVVLERVRPRIAASQTVRATIPPDLAPLSGSAETWMEILTELVTNGLETTTAGGLVTVRAEPAGSARVRVVVEDTGRGIPAEAVPHILEPLRAAGTGAPRTGIGLPMVASLVEGLGGTIRIATKPGEGTTVELDVPAAAGGPVVRFEGEVLVADDDRLTREGMAVLVSSLGFTAVQCDSGTVARTLLTGQPERFRLAVLDVVMPGTPVDQVVRAAREARPGFPALLVSGYDTVAHVDEVLSAGGARFLRKPFTRSAFHEAITDLLGGGTPGPAARPSSPSS